MPLLDLRRQAAAERITLPAELGLGEADRQAAIATWKGRMVNEHISARIFAGLVPQLMRAEIDADHQAAVATMISDELRHARLCAAAALALGGDPVAPLPPLEPVPEHDDASPLEAVLRNVISVSCLSETVAVALIDAERLQAGPPVLAELLRSILADEVQHARFGWRLLEELEPRLDRRLRARLGEYLVVALAHLRAHELRHIPARAAPSSAAEAVGVCDGNAARELLFQTIGEVIIPGLCAHGLPARAAWERSLKIAA
ncbi:MAG: ferritin-like domain-containing protein [Myxococcales bacterium]|nr:ferritin-like domain-containing protein [Myxococcales bacterium]MCB9705700.1 ferritin-like domain-containing protein [Myxococcales bacterium]